MSDNQFNRRELALLWALASREAGRSWCRPMYEELKKLAGKALKIGCTQINPEMQNYDTECAVKDLEHLEEIRAAKESKPKKAKTRKEKAKDEQEPTR